MPIHRPFRNDNYITFVQYIQYVFPVSAIICMNRPHDTLFAVCTQFDRAAAPWNKKFVFCKFNMVLQAVAMHSHRIQNKKPPDLRFGTAFQYRFNIQSLISAAFGFTIKRSLSGLVCGVLVILTAAACFFFSVRCFSHSIFRAVSRGPP